MRNAALHLYWNREKENRGEWKKDVMFSCCRNEKATEVILNLRIPLCPDIHPPDQHSPLPVCMLVFCLLPGWKEPLRATQHFSDPALSSHHMTRVEHTQSHDLSTTALLFQVTGAAGHDTTPCLVPCPAGLRQTHTDDRTSTYTASMTSGFTWHPPDSIHTGTQKKNTLRLYKELNSH